MRARNLLIGTSIVTLSIAAPLRASAGCVPDFSNVTIPPAIDVMGVSGAGVPDPRAAFDIIVRDVANNPVAGAVVMVDFSNCTDLRLSRQSSGATNPALEGQELDCSLRSIRGVTDATGRVHLSVLGAGTNVAGGPTPGPGSACARVFIDGQLIRSTIVRIFDQNGAAGAPTASTSRTSRAGWWTSAAVSTSRAPTTE